MFEILVFGCNFEDIASVDGWQIIWQGDCQAHAEIALRGLIANYGEDRVDYNW